MKSSATSLVDYSMTAKIFHWITAITFLIQFPVGFIMVQLSPGASASFLQSTHEALGFFILWVALLRTAYRLTTSIERRGSKLAHWHERASRFAHSMLYGLMILVPLTGWMGASAYNSLDLFGIASLPAIMSHDEARAVWILWTHGLLAFSMIALVSVHISIALQGYLDGPNVIESSAAPLPNTSSLR